MEAQERIEAGMVEEARKGGRDGRKEGKGGERGSH